MKKILVLLTMLSSICCSQVMGPKISAQQAQYDFGKISSMDKVVHDFVISNVGDDTLIIDDVRVGCGCTAVKPEKNKLLPNESTKINVTFDASGRRGHQQKYVYIMSNDKDTPELRLVFTADINDSGKVHSGAILKFDYNSHDFGPIEEGKVVEWTVGFKNTGDKVLEIKDVNTSCGCTAAVISGKIINPGEKGSMKIEFDSKNKNGKITKTVSINSNDVMNPTNTIIIMADVNAKKN